MTESLFTRATILKHACVECYVGCCCTQMHMSPFSFANWTTRWSAGCRAVPVWEEGQAGGRLAEALPQVWICPALREKKGDCCWWDSPEQNCPPICPQPHTGQYTAVVVHSDYHPLAPYGNGSSSRKQSLFDLLLLCPWCTCIFYTTGQNFQIRQ